MVQGLAADTPGVYYPNSVLEDEPGVVPGGVPVAVATLPTPPLSISAWVTV